MVGKRGELSVCPECLEARVVQNPETGELVCASCGLVLGESGEYDQRLSFDTTYALTSELAFGKSLGGTLGERGVMAVLAKSPSSVELAKAEGNMHLGIRARLLSWLAEADPPALRVALNKGCVLARQYNLASNFEFTNYLGRLIRKAFSFAYHAAGKHKFKMRLAETCFWIALAAFGKHSLAESFRRKHKLNFYLLVAMETLPSFLEDVERRARLRMKVQHLPLEELAEPL